MKFKTQFIDVVIKCPFTNKMVNTMFIDKEMYKYYINKGFGFMFEEIKEDIEEITDESISE